MDHQLYQDRKAYTVKSRQIVFEREIRRLQCLMEGRTAPIWPYMVDSAGEYSEEQTVKFVSWLLERTPGKHFSFCQDLIYCVLRTMTSGYTEYHMGNITGFGDPQVIPFSALIDGFGGSPFSLLDSYTMYFMEVLYEIFTGEKIRWSLPGMEAEREEFTEEMKKQMEEEGEARIAMEDALAKRQGVDMEAVREWEKEEAGQLELQRLKERARIKENFAEQEHFCKSLNRICEYLKQNEVELVRLKSDLKEGILQFLSDRELAVFQDEEGFVAVMVQLKKTIRQAQKLAKD